MQKPINTYNMNATLKNLERVFNFISEHHADNNVHGEFDEEMDLKDVLAKAYEHLEDEPLYMCNSCHEHFTREEMDFDVDDDQDLCKTCNYQSFNEAPYGEE
jgi:formylmethanofuran dehydrogenase subunit E